MDPGFSRQLIYTCLVYMNSFLIGISRGFTNFMGKHLDPSTDIIIQNDISWIGSLCVLLNPVGSLIAGVLMDRFGRVMTMKLATLLVTCGWLIVASVTDIFYLYGAYTIVGISIGMTLTCTVYVAEISSDKLRCILLSIFIIFYSTGVMVAYLITYFLHWKLSSWVFMAMSAVTCMLLFLLHEPPQWYVKQGKREKAIREFQIIRQSGRGDAEKEYEKAVEDLKNHSNTNVKHILSSWKPLLIAMVFQILVQCSGFVVLIVHSSLLFKDIVMNANEMLLTYSVAVFLSSFFSPFAALFGSRKKLVIISSFLVAVTLIVMLVSVRYKYPCVIQICSYIYVFFNIACTLSIVESLPSEIFRLQVRGVMCGILQAYSTVLQGILIKIFPDFLAATSVSFVLMTFTAFSIALVFFGIFFLPETKGKTLEQIQEEYFYKRPSNLAVEK